MKILLAGASGAIGRRLVPLLRAAGHDVVGTTRSAGKTAAVAALGAEPAVVDVFDAAALTCVVQAAAPQVVIHQLTDLPYAPNTPGYDEGLERLAPHAPVSQYRHNRTGEDNADAHLKRQMMGRGVVVAVTRGALDFGPWEQIFYGEFDGRRPKRVLVKIIGD